jgi:ribosomal protein S18 acetylase RimI-like enzyme
VHTYFGRCSNAPYPVIHPAKQANNLPEGNERLHGTPYGKFYYLRGTCVPLCFHLRNNLLLKNYPMNHTNQTVESITIHCMLATDVEAVANLWLALIGEHTACDRRYFTTYRSNYMRKIQFLEAALRDPQEQIWLARVDAEIVGYCSAYVSYVTGMYNAHIEATLGDIYVAPEHRAEGIGKLLLNQAKQWAQIMEANTLRLNVHSANSQAIAYYLKNGFEEKFKVMTFTL